MSRPPSQLDRQVETFVQGVLEEDDSAVSVYYVYDRIQTSQSSLKRTKKRLLEDSIARVLRRLQVSESDGESERQSGAQEPKDTPSSEVMNKHLRDSMRKQFASTSDSQANGESRQEAPEASRPRRQATEAAPGQRPAKRARTSDIAVVPAPTHVRRTDLGGMGHIFKQLIKLVIVPMRRPQLCKALCINIPRGILIHGPPGCGKTKLCEAIAGEIGLPWLPISGPSIVSGMSGESEKAIRQHFEAAIQAAPCIIFIDEIDAIAPKRETSSREMEKRIVAQLVTCMDDLDMAKTGGNPVIVLATTSRPDGIDSGLRRAGRFDVELPVGVPTEDARRLILEAQTRDMKLSPDVDLKRLARLTAGYVGADLNSLVYEACSTCMERWLQTVKALAGSKGLVQGDKGASGDVDGSSMQVDSDPPQLPESDDPGVEWDIFNSILATDIGMEDEVAQTLCMADFLEALPRVQPSAKREGFATIPNTTWAEVGALNGVRKELQSSFVEPIQNREKYERMAITAPAGVLLWGPPGCGKTLLAKALANESKTNFISVKGPELLNKYVGESERAVRQLFFRAAASAPCIIFFDELDALVPRRDGTMSEASARVVNALLTELDGLNARKDVYVIAATNRPEMIDPAMLRPGRLGKHIEIPPPTPDERVEILHTLLQKLPLRQVDDRVKLAEYARGLKDFTGADLGGLVYEASLHAVDRDSEYLEAADIEAAATKVRASIKSDFMGRDDKVKADKIRDERWR